MFTAANIQKKMNKYNIILYCYGHCCQTAAEGERPTTNGLHTVGEGDRCETAATREGSVAHALHAAGDVDRS